MVVREELQMVEMKMWMVVWEELGVEDSRGLYNERVEGRGREIKDWCVCVCVCVCVWASRRGG